MEEPDKPGLRQEFERSSRAPGRGAGYADTSIDGGQRPDCKLIAFEFDPRSYLSMPMNMKTLR